MTDTGIVTDDIVMERGWLRLSMDQPLRTNQQVQN